MVAVCPSVARMLGFCSTLVSVSLSSAFSVPPPMVTAKLVAFILARVFSVNAELLVVPEAVLVGVLLACGLMPNDCGRLMPRLRILSRFTSRMATSTTTSALVRSRSLSSFSASTRCSGGARMITAFCDWIRYILSSAGNRLRSAVTISLASLCWLALVR